MHHFLSLDLPGEKWGAGTGPEEARLKRQFPGARWFGVMSGDDLAAVYRSADVMVFPSVTDTFGLVIAESMACGTPVAAYPVPGPIDVVGRDSPGGVLNNDLRAACLAALKKPREAVRRHAEQFNWPTATHQFEQALVLLPHAASRATPQGSASALASR